MAFKDEDLAGSFPPASEAQWRESVERALKGGAFEKLVSKTYDGATINPLYQRSTSPAPRALRYPSGRWAILARVDIAEPEAANAQALVDLEGGAGGLSVIFAGSQGAYGSALGNDGDASIARVFDRVRLEYGIPVMIEHSPLAPNAAEAMMRFLDKNHIEPSITRVSFGFDPLGAQLRHGFALTPWSDGAKRFADQAKRAANAGFTHGTVAADARVVHAAGGTEAQELSFALAAALAYLRALSDAGLDLDAARKMLMFRLAVDADEFAGIAKFRALRRLWARVEESCGLAPAPTLLHAETAWRMMTASDPWNNLLRATVAVFSAAVGGADAIVALPFTQALGAPDDFARRLARDTQIVLQDESYVHIVDDPAAGAGGFEALTDEICARAWSEFQEIELAGGLASALDSGRLQSKVAQTAGERAKNVARGKDKITGANEFPNIHESALRVLAKFDERIAEAAAPQGAHKSPKLTPRRLSEAFERLRDLSDAHLASSGVRPRVFLANLGSVATFTARANFAKNFFEAGGVEAVFGPETDDNTQIVDAYRNSGAKLACLCSSDKIYCDAAIPVAVALQDAGAKLYLAGRPGEMQAQLNQAGVTRFVFTGCDMHDMLRLALEEAI